MKKIDIQIVGQYIAKVSGKLVPVQILRDSVYGGWDGKNTVTGREVRIRTAGKLRRRAGETTFSVTCSKCGVVYNSHFPQSDYDSGKVSHRKELCSVRRFCSSAGCQNLTSDMFCAMHKSEAL
jgi:hypothetical protein